MKDKTLLKRLICWLSVIIFTVSSVTVSAEDNDAVSGTIATLVVHCINECVITQKLYQIRVVSVAGEGLKPT